MTEALKILSTLLSCQQEFLLDMMEGRSDVGKISFHMRDAGKVRVRILAGEQYLAEAKQVTPTLEDAYMWLMGRTGRNQGGPS